MIIVLVSVSVQSEIKLFELFDCDMQQSMKLEINRWSRRWLREKKITVEKMVYRRFNQAIDIIINWLLAFCAMVACNYTQENDGKFYVYEFRNQFVMLSVFLVHSKCFFYGKKLAWFLF